MPAYQIALRLLQEALLKLNVWVEGSLSLDSLKLNPNEEQAIAKAKDLTHWNETASPDALQIVFDAISLKKETSSKINSHFWPMRAISDEKPAISYPVRQIDSSQLEGLKKEIIKPELNKLSKKDWENFSLLLLILEKYGSYISFGDADVAFFDRVRATAAVATSLADNPNAEELCLVAGDLSGIQPFIYTIASDGALKSLRARSFYLELVTEEMTQQLLERLDLPRTSVIYTGGGKSFLLAPASDRTQSVLHQLKDEFNQELLRQFQGKVFLNLTGLNFDTPLVDKPEFAKIWEAVNDDLSQQKARKFDIQIDHLLNPQHAHEPCRVCHRDDLKSEELEPLGGDGPEACPTCNEMYYLGQKLFKVGKLVRSKNKNIEGTLRYSDASHDKGYLEIKIGGEPVYYHLFESEQKIISKDSQTVYFINNWNIESYRFSQLNNPTLLLLGNYSQRSQESKGDRETFITAQEMSEHSQGIKRVGHLRMDVDRLGQIFAQGLGKHYNLPRLAGLSRQMSYFFKVYLNSLAEDRQQNFLAHQSNFHFKSLPKPSNSSDSSKKSDKAEQKEKRKNLLFIYAGGDDLFITGAWDELVEFAFDVYQSFRAYTGNHPDITLSGGISLSGPKYPLYQSAEDSGSAEGEAKAQGRDRLTLFGQTFQWGEWLGAENTPVSEIKAIDNKLRKYIDKSHNDPTLALFGVFLFVEKLQPLLSTNFPKSFTRNLLSTAQMQEQFLKQAKKTDKPKLEKDEDIKAIQYFLHLPKVAYTLARLPKQIQQAEGFEDIRKSLKSSYNAPYFRAIATWLDLLNRSSNRSDDNRQ